MINHRLETMKLLAEQVVVTDRVACEFYRDRSAGGSQYMWGRSRGLLTAMMLLAESEEEFQQVLAEAGSDRAGMRADKPSAPERYAWYQLREKPKMELKTADPYFWSSQVTHDVHASREMAEQALTKAGPQLTIDDLANGLRAYPRFTELRVFADDLDQEVFVTEGRRLYPSSKFNISLCLEDVWYHSVMGVVLFSNDSERPQCSEISRSNSNAHESVLKARAIKGSNWSRRHAVGVFSNPISNVERKNIIMVVSFDLDTRTWVPYEGGLTRWIKDKMLNTKDRTEQADHKSERLTSPT
jgi:hypothetical protein